MVMCSAAKSRMTLSTSFVSSGSSALVGSSKNRTSGSSASARAMATRCCMPPDSSQGTLSSVPSSPIFASRARACSMTSLLGRFCTCNGASVTFFSTV